MWEKKQTWPLWSSTLSLFSVHIINQSSDFSNSPSKPSRACMLLYIHSSFIHTLTHSTVLCFLSSCGSPTMNKVWKTFPLFVVVFFCFVHVIFNTTVYTVLLTQMLWGRTRQICEDWGRWGGGLLDALDLWFSHSIGEVTACWRGSSMRNQDPFWTDGNPKPAQHRKVSSFHGMKLKEGMPWGMAGTALNLQPVPWEWMFKQGIWKIRQWPPWERLDDWNDKRTNKALEPNQLIWSSRS